MALDTKSIEAQRKPKLLINYFDEVSLDVKETKGMSIQQIAEQFLRFSRDSMAKGVLDDIGEQIFTTGKIRKVLDKLFLEPPNTLIKLIRSTVRDDSISPNQVKTALKRLWNLSSQAEIPSDEEPSNRPHHQPPRVTGRGTEYPEGHHLEGKPQEVIELFRSIDNFCRELDPINVRRMYLAKWVKYSCGKHIFCCVHIYNSGLRVWLKLKYHELNNPPAYARDVSRIGHWGTGDVELVIDSSDKLQSAKVLIKKSFEKKTAG